MKKHIISILTFIFIVSIALAGTPSDSGYNKSLRNILKSVKFTNSEIDSLLDYNIIRDNGSRFLLKISDDGERGTVFNLDSCKCEQSYELYDIYKPNFGRKSIGLNYEK